MTTIAILLLYSSLIPPSHIIGATKPNYKLSWHRTDQLCFNACIFEGRA